MIEKPVTENDIVDNMHNAFWRLTHLYKIVDKKGKLVTFKPNEPQMMFLNDMHTRNVILKARQMGFSTLIELLMLDTALFTDTHRAVVIAQSQDHAGTMFRDKFKNVYANLPEPIKKLKPLVEDSASALMFGNDSSVLVTTSARSGTINFLHVSELGVIANAYPSKANEIITGTIPAVPESGIIVVESTAKGQEGVFKDLVDISMKMQGKELDVEHWRFHFYGWWRMKEYRANAEKSVITRADTLYFDALEEKIGQRIDNDQRAWYVNTRDISLLGNVESMWSEHPSLPAEAFQVSLEGAYFKEQIMLLRKKDQIGKCPYDPRYPVNTFWDLGANDSTAIWFIQEMRGTYHVIGYYENNGEPFEFYVKVLSGYQYVWGTHFLPHDANHRRQQGLKNQTPAEMIQECAPGWKLEIVNKTADKQIAIQQARSFLPLCVFDEAACKEGIERLENYRKKWNAKTGTWSSSPLHDSNSNGADAFLTAAQAKANGDFANYNYDQTNYEPPEEVW